MFPKLLKLSILFVLLLAGYNIASASFTVSRPSTNNLGLVGHWTFDGKNVVNGVALDSTSNANNGNLVGIATSTFYTAGKIGQGFNFDGTDDNVKITGLLGSPANATLSAWAKVDGYDTQGATLISLGDVFGIVLTTTAPFYNRGFFYNGSKWEATSWNATYTNTGWHHFAYTMDDTNNSQKIYVDGNVATSTVLTTSISYAGQGANTIIGRHGNGASNADFKGNIDDPRVYSRALSAGEIKNLYNQGVSKLNKTPTNILTSGLVGHWTFDGKNVVNGVALDSSGNANNGNLKSIATSTFYSTGKIGQGFNFDGVNDYINLGNPASLKLTGSMTFSVWVKLSSIPTGGKNIISRNGSAGNRGWGFMACGDCSTDIWRFIISSNGTDMIFRDSVSIFSTVWTHVTEVYNASAQTMDVYINGVLDNGTLTGTVPASQFNSTIGPDIGASPSETGGGFFPGVIDDLRVYNRALSVGEVKNLYNQGVSKFNKTPTNTLTSSLVGHWTFDGKNVVNGVALDSSGNANNGNLVNIATSTFYSTGKIGQGFNFDGVNDYVSVADNSNWAFGTGDFSVNTWIKFNDSTDDQMIFAQGTDGSNQQRLYMRFSTNKFTYTLEAGVTAILEWTWTPVVGKWYYLNLVRSGNSWIVYVNGIALGTNTNSSSVSNYTGGFIIGHDYDGSGNAFSGIMDSFSVYKSRALSAAEIKMLYNMGR